MFVTIPNVLANRYASAEMVAIWSPEAKIVAERRLWLAVLRAQAELGVAVPEAAECVTTTTTLAYGGRVTRPNTSIYAFVGSRFPRPPWAL